MHEANAVATRSVGEKASPFPLLSVGASVIIVFQSEYVWPQSLERLYRLLLMSFSSLIDFDDKGTKYL